MPLAFAAHAGSLLALTGTPVNVIISESAKDAGVGAFGFFSFALVGVPLLVGTIAIILLFGERLLPDRQPRVSSRNFSEHARTLVDTYSLDDDPDALTDEALGRGGDRDPAALGADRRARVSGNGHRQRRSRRARSAAPRRGHRARGDGAGRGRLAAPAGLVGRARAPPRRSVGARRRLTRGGAAADRAARARRVGVDRRARDDGRAARHRGRTAGGRRASSRPGRSCSFAC